jgi:D-arabinose 1-dehydrogenase-like Zn-dependent alcohol dehydrogenase
VSGELGSASGWAGMAATAGSASRAGVAIMWPAKTSEPSGTSIDSEDTLKFSALTGVKPLIEKYPLDKAPEAYDRMMSGKARFRVVLETGA